jgi:hypothetical protein
VIALRRLVDGEVVREAVFTAAPPLTLGRDAGADFPLLDPTVSHAHARLVRDEKGALWLEDAGSRNGVVVGHERVERVGVPENGSLRFFLGAVEVEVAVAGGEATLEWRHDEAPTRPVSVLRTCAYWALGVAAVVGSSVLSSTFWSPWQKERLTGAIQVAISAAVALPVAAFILVGLLRVARRRARLADTLRALAMVLGLGLVVGALSVVVPYLARPETQPWLLAVLQVPAGIFAVAYLASVARREPGRRYFWGWAGITALALLGFFVVGQMASRHEGVPNVRYGLSVPLGGYSGPRGDLGAYFEGVRRDFKEAQREATEEDRRRHGR